MLLGTSLKFEGRFQLQTRTDGAVDMLVVDFEAPDRVRAYARFDAERLAAAGRQRRHAADLLGRGHLALTIDQGADMQRYQGIVALEASPSRRRRTSISASPSRSRRVCGSPSARRWARRPGAATPGGPAG